MRAIFAGSILELETYPDYTDVAETANDYIENARLKAQALRKQLHDVGISVAVLADDSGLEVDALDGRPGVLSARYAGPNATWPDRRQKLLGELLDVANSRRTARFVCAMVLILPNGTELSAVGVLDGSIAEEERGSTGFGYDPIFVPQKEERTFAQFSFEEKNRVSHRKKAADELLVELSEK